MDWVEVLRNGSIIIAAFTAIYGISSWRREFSGKRRIELAEEALAMFYEARDAISFIRNPASDVGEGLTRRAREGETPEVKRARDDAFITVERYQKHQELFSKLHAKRYRFVAVFGHEAAQPFRDLQMVIKEVLTAARILSRHWLLQHRQQIAGFEELAARIERQEALIWEGFGDPDPIAPRVETIVAEMERTCNRIINPENWGLALLKRGWILVRRPLLRVTGRR